MRVWCLIVVAVGTAGVRADVPVPVAVTPAGGPAVPPGAPPVAPPLTLPVIGEPLPGPPLPAGTPVSQPLQPVGAMEVPAPAPIVAESATAVAVAHTLPASWSSDEVLFWWSKAHPLPPLATGNRTGGLPALGGANTTVLIGGRSLDSQDTAGGRFTYGWAVNDARTVGVEAAYFFLGTRTYRETASDAVGDRTPVVGRPFVNAATGREDAVLVAFPGAGTGRVDVATSTRATGWEVGGVAALYAADDARLTASAGYRYFMVNEGLRVEQASLRFAGPGGPAILAQLADQIDAHNRFHGGQLGLTADISRGGVYVELVGKVALGQTVEVVRVSGQGAMVTAGNPLPLLQSFNTAVLGQASNTGRLGRSVFAVLPEARVKIGYRFGDNSRAFVGYDFLYLSDAVRPGDQVDRALNPAGVPVLQAFGSGGLLAGPDRPRLAVARTDFWVQGLVLGLEYRY